MQPVPNGSDRGSYPGGTCSDHQYRVVSPDSVVAKSMIDYEYSSDNLVTDTDGSDTCAQQEKIVQDFMSV